ncbi:MAG: phosphoribosylamine--glycine ligase [Cyclobacteriaceae bacterium]
MNILILGSGGREHAFAWKIAQSDHCKELFVAPGNAGTADIATNLALDLKDFDAVGKAVLNHEIDLVIVGPEEPLVLGIADHFKREKELMDILVLGPGEYGARLEGSKDYSKIFMDKYNVPTPPSKTFVSGIINDGYTYLESLKPPYVLKADGLAAGKGVVITEDLAEAKSLLKEMLMEDKFGNAGSRVIIEEFLHGIELSVFVLTDGKSYKILPEAKDYKRIGEGDKGLNTGGMGAVSPVPFADKAFMSKVEEKVVLPTIEGLKSEDIDYRGFIFIGLMNVDGEPYVIEYNVRMGDPETQAVLPRITSDFAELLKAAADCTLDQVELTVSDDTAVSVVGVSGGYPEAYTKGYGIKGLDLDVEATVFHAGTIAESDKVLTNGGRVIAVTGIGKNLTDAVANSYKAMESISWEDKYFRRDIGKDLM